MNCWVAAPSLTHDFWNNCVALHKKCELYAVLLDGSILRDFTSQPRPRRLFTKQLFLSHHARYFPKTSSEGSLSELAWEIISRWVSGEGSMQTFQRKPARIFVKMPPIARKKDWCRLTHCRPWDLLIGAEKNFDNQGVHSFFIINLLIMRDELIAKVSTVLRTWLDRCYWKE